eukprot:15471301-Alexandrium_andersonii.AAC.1
MVVGRGAQPRSANRCMLRVLWVTCCLVHRSCDVGRMIGCVPHRHCVNIIRCLPQCGPLQKFAASRWSACNWSRNQCGRATSRPRLTGEEHW